MQDQPLVSVLMTAYNREKYIAEAIESVIASTYQNWELIIVDDGSKDKTVEIARSYEVKDDRIKVYINEKNLGDYPNRNKAASYAKGKYLKYLDADDLIYPHGLEVMVRTIEKYPEAAYALSKPDNNITPLPILLSPVDSYKKHIFEKPIFTNSPLGAIIRKDIFEKLGGFTGKQHVGDMEMWMRFSAIYSVVLIPSGLGFWRAHNEQQSNDNNTDPKVVFKYLIIEYNLYNNHNCPLSKDDKASALNINLKKQARYILKHFITQGPKIAIKIKQQSSLTYKDILIKAFSHF